MPPRNVSSVIRQLQSSKGARQLQQAAEAARQLVSGSESDLRQFVDGGGVEALAGVLHSRGSGSTAAKQAAVGALSVLTRSAYEQPPVKQGGYVYRISNAVAGAGGTRPLVQLLQHAAASSSATLLDDAMYVLLSIVLLGPTDLAAVADAGAIPLLLEMPLSRLPTVTRGNAAHVLACMAQDGPSICHAVAASGGVQRIAAALQGTFDTASDESPSMLPRLQEWLATTLCSVARLAEEGDAAAFATSVPPLLQCLAEGGRAAQVAAGGTLVNVALRWTHLLAAVVAAGGITVALGLLQHSTDTTLLEHAARLLYLISRDLPERHAELRTAGAVPAVQHLEGTCQDANVQGAARLALQCLGPDSEAEATSKGQQDGPASSSCDASLPSRPPRVCAAPGCGTARRLKRCGGCGTVRYCSPECSRAHWPEHKAECRRLQAERAAGDVAAPVQP